jgi:hypothetical protein
MGYSQIAVKHGDCGDGGENLIRIADKKMPGPMKAPGSFEELDMTVLDRAVRRKKSFDFCAKRRREIVLHARHVGAADTEDFSRWLIAWVWHNRKAKDQIWSVMNAARNMGREITEAEASEITEEASITRRHLSADNLARFLGVTFEQRQRLGLTTIGSVNVKKGARRELRRRNNRLAKEAKRRAKGMRPRVEYEGNSLSATKPWKAMNMCRRTWERHRNKARVASPGTPSFLPSEDTPATPGGSERDCADFPLPVLHGRASLAEVQISEGVAAPLKGKGTYVSRRRPRWLLTYMRHFRWN